MSYDQRFKASYVSTFNELTVNLPEDATKWTLQLCSAYLSALSKDLSERITSESSFIMPNLSTLTTKALRLEALTVVHTLASSSYRELEKEEKIMTTLLRSIAPTTGNNITMHSGMTSFRPGVNELTYENVPNGKSETIYGNIHFQNSQSIPESTIA